jgi:hypothetical protein
MIIGFSNVDPEHGRNDGKASTETVEAKIL